MFIELTKNYDSKIIVNANLIESIQSSEDGCVLFMLDPQCDYRIKVKEDYETIKKMLDVVEMADIDWM